MLSVQNGHMDHYIYGGWWSVWWTGTYSMVLSKAAFFHKKYLKLYTNEMPSSIKDFITKNRFLIRCLSFLMGHLFSVVPANVCVFVSLYTITKSWIEFHQEL